MMTTMMRVNMLMAGRFLAQAVYRGDSPSRADAPSARIVGWASLSLTLRFCGWPDGLQVLFLRFAQGQDARPVKLPRLGGEVFPSQARLFAVEFAESGEV